MKLSCSATVGQSRAKMKPWKKWAIFASGLFLLVCIAVASLYVAQVNYGVCLKEGRVLSPEELRERVLVNFVNLMIQNEYDDSWFIGNDYTWVGMASPFIGTDLKEVVEKAYISEKSLEENFNLEALVKGRKPGEKGLVLSADQLKEPFMITSYDVSSARSGFAEVFMSTDIKATSLKQEGYVFDKPGIFNFSEYFPVFYKNLCGYNNHYYTIKRILYKQECCDNRYKSVFSQGEYLERRRAAFEEMIKDIEKEKHFLLLAAISNCGDILTEENDMGWPSRMINRTYLLKYINIDKESSILPTD